MACTANKEKLVRSQAVVARVVGGETLIVPVRSRVGDLSSIYSFNGTGTLIWKLLEAPQTLPELAAGVTREFSVEAAQAERDVAAFISDMREAGLIESAVQE